MHQRRSGDTARLLVVWQSDVIGDDHQMKSVHVEDGTCTVNFTKELNQLQGETGQSLFIAMTVDTLIEFPNIKRVEFRAEGQLVKFQIDMRKQFLRDEAFIKQTKK